MKQLSVIGYNPFFRLFPNVEILHAHFHTDGRSGVNAMFEPFDEKAVSVTDYRVVTTEVIYMPRIVHVLKTMPRMKSLRFITVGVGYVRPDVLIEILRECPLLENLEMVVLTRPWSPVLNPAYHRHTGLRRLVLRRRLDHGAYDFWTTALLDCLPNLAEFHYERHSWTDLPPTRFDDVLKAVNDHPSVNRLVFTYMNNVASADVLHDLRLLYNVAEITFIYVVAARRLMADLDVDAIPAMFPGQKVRVFVREQRLS